MALRKELIAIALLDSSARGTKGVSGFCWLHTVIVCVARR